MRSPLTTGEVLAELRRLDPAHRCAEGLNNARLRYDGALVFCLGRDKPTASELAAFVRLSATLKTPEVVDMSIPCYLWGKPIDLQLLAEITGANHGKAAN